MLPLAATVLVIVTILILLRPLLAAMAALMSWLLRLFLGKRAVFGAAAERDAHWSIFAGCLRWRGVVRLRRGLRRSLRLLRALAAGVMLMARGVLLGLRVRPLGRCLRTYFGARSYVWRLDRCTEIADFPGRLCCGCGRCGFFFWALPISFDCMAAFAIDALGSGFGLRKRRFFRELLIGIEFAFDTRVDFGLLFFVEKAALGQILYIAVKRIARFPVLEHFLGDVIGGVVLRVAFHAHRLRLD